MHFAGGDSGGFAARFSAAKARVSAFSRFQKTKGSAGGGAFYFCFDAVLRLCRKQSCSSAADGNMFCKGRITGWDLLVKQNTAQKQMAFMARALRKTSRKWRIVPQANPANPHEMGVFSKPTNKAA
ncbi:hypothetical protein H8S23_13540 [Anaerofilum sp. BX8]|uniref:Uncharacterized protein n=1 Tax=Anaerofilum hominis TaxID=2763016 RepID=A0A923L2A0_9FIRM|nr:hypothetical protein [Anaerofilum hominis]MBC5582532.1 hypothetical protein [Anaerofilum hominis]